MILYYLLVLSLPLISQRFFAMRIGGITGVKYLGVLCLLYAVFYMATTSRVPRFFRTGQARAFLLFYMLVTVSYFTIGVRGSAFDSIWSIYTSHVYFFITTVILVDSPRRLRMTLLAAVGSILWASLYTLREWQLGAAKYGVAYRPGYVAGDPNFFTASAVLCVPLGFYLMLNGQKRLERWFCLGALLTTLGGIMVAASRGGFLGLVAASVILVWKSAHRFKNIAIVSGLLACFLLFSPSSPLERLLDPSRSDIEAQQIRLVVWRAGLRMIEEHPLFGVGVGNFERVVVEYEQDANIKIMAHNTYIELAAELGIPGLLIFLTMVGFTFRSLNRIRSLAAKQENQLVGLAAAGIAAGIVGFCVACFFVSAWFLKLFWLMIFLSACLPNILENKEPVSTLATTGSEAQGFLRIPAADSALGGFVRERADWNKAN